MKQTKILCGAFSLLGVACLILFRETAVKAASEAIAFCLQTVIPGLFPFFFLTGLLLGNLNPRWLNSLEKLLCLPGGTGPILIPAFLGGYPMGAAAVSEAYRSGTLKKSSAEYLLSFCSNAGPAFFFGILPMAFPEKKWLFLLWGIHAGSALLVSMLQSPPEGSVSFRKIRCLTPAQAMESALRSTAFVCGWILCFRVILSFLDQWVLWRFPPWAQIFFTGLTELTVGAGRLPLLPSWQEKFVMTAGLLGFGGLCVTMQTASVLGELSLKPYLKGKLLQGLFSMLFALAFVKGFLLYALLMAFFITGILKGIQMKGRKNIPHIV